MSVRKPIYRRWWFWVAAVLLLILMLLTLWGNLGRNAAPAVRQGVEAGEAL